MKKKSKTKLPTFRVWIEQVNATCIDVRAADRGDASKKAMRKWRREWSYPHVTDIRQIP